MKHSGDLSVAFVRPTLSRARFPDPLASKSAPKGAEWLHWN